MSARLPLTLACGDYEIVRALRDGTVKPDGIDLTVLTEMDSNTRHHRFLKGREFDVAEVSSCAYITARGQDLPFMALPVFLHRRFRHGFIFVNTGKGIRQPKDLIGRKVGLKSWQNSALTWLRGILEHEYGVPHRSIEWVSDLDEHVAFTPPAGLELSQVRDDQSVEQMLAEGEIDALLHPDIIEPLLARDPRVGRLFPDYRGEQIRYFKKTGIFPIMHFLGIKPELVERYPWAPLNLQIAFDKAKGIAMTRIANPRRMPIVLAMETLEEQAEIFGNDPWEYGLGATNSNNLETLIGYCHEQGLTPRRLRLDELFLNPTAGAKRDGKFRI